MGDLKYRNYPYLRETFEYLPMPKKDLFHDNVRVALEKEGWVITHDPYFIRLGKRKGFIDLGAELLRQSAVWIKLRLKSKDSQACQKLMSLKMLSGSF